MYKARLVFFMLLGIAQASHAAVPQDQPGEWVTFLDEQYGTSVQYPSWFSVSGGQSALGRGERRLTEDRRAEIEVYSLPNPAHKTPSDYLAEKLRLNPATLHYKRVTQRFFALSAAQDGKIHYTRCNFSQTAGGVIHCIYLGYPQSEKRAWDDIVTKVSLSLRP